MNTSRDKALTEGNLHPSIGAAWPGIDGVYAGVSAGDDGQPDAHLILLNALPPRKMNWVDACGWAESLGDGAHAPTRFESALLYANLRACIELGEWYWTSTQYSSNDAWSQLFDNGPQTNYDGKKFEARARAVRRLPLQSFNPSIVEVAPRPDVATALLRQILDEAKGLRTDMRTIFLADTGVDA